jgi:transposase
VEERKSVESPLNLFGLREEGMLTEDQWGAVKSLYGRGVKKKAIARMLGIDIKTVRRYLRQGQWRGYRRSVGRPTLLVPYRERLLAEAPRVDYCAQVLYQRIKEEGFRGSYEAVKRFIRPYRQQQRHLEEATVRFETGPGKQAQVDWGSTEVLIAGQWVRIQLFVMVLGYSRSLYAHAERDQKIGSLIRCHELAWDWFSGRTQEILYDNPKTICLKRDAEGKQIEWNPLFLDFSRYFGFTPRLCRPYRARTKGKVESGIKYVKRNFLKGRSFASLGQLNEALEHWIRTVADLRLHGTTHERPVDRAKKEELMATAGHPPYRIEQQISRQVASDCLVCVETNRYSVPHRYVGRQVEVVRVGGEIRIYQGEQCIATHPILEGKYQRRMLPAHYEGLWGRSGRTPLASDRVHDGRWGDLPDEVAIRPLSEYEALCGEGGGR